MSQRDDRLSVDELLIAQADVVEQLLEELGGIRQNLKGHWGLVDEYLWRLEDR